MPADLPDWFSTGRRFARSRGPGRLAGHEAIDACKQTSPEPMFLDILAIDEVNCPNG